MKSQALPILASLALCATALAQSTAFTYQGELKTGGMPATGAHDMRFQVFDAASGGTDIGSNCAESVAVVDGRFGVALDYATLISSAAPRYLEISVRADTAPGCGDPTGYTVLAPRQLIMPTPLAIHAHMCTNASVATHSITSTLAAAANSLVPPDGSPANAVFVDNNGRVGIGTTAPSHNMHIAAPIPTLALHDSDSTTQQVGYISFRDSANAERAWVGYGTIGDPDFSIVNARPSGDIVLLPITGNVGIGTSTPTAKLEVHGDIRLGSSGQFFAVKSPQSDRTLRGSVGGSGVIGAGSGTGFTITQTGTGRYTINFSQAFTAAPTVVITSVSAARQVNLNATLTTGVGIQVTDLSGVDANGGFTFIVIGQ